MPRATRLILEGVVYHIITRGNQRQPVFIAKDDYQKYLTILTRYKKRYHFWLYGWCLMNNHVHLLLEPNSAYATITAIMRRINLSYTIWFNSRYGKVGHLWQDRFKSYIIEKDQYLTSCINYIEQNPIRANLVDSPEKYLFTSYRYRVLGIKNEILDTIGAGVSPQGASEPSMHF